MSGETPCGKYPLPRAEEDARFTLGLLADVAEVLARHGYPAVEAGGDLIDLQQALFRFLYAGSCTAKGQP
jgi:hypothetical protein